MVEVRPSTLNPLATGLNVADRPGAVRQRFG
jgi:hypothetical protein